MIKKIAPLFILILVVLFYLYQDHTSPSNPEVSELLDQELKSQVEGAPKLNPEEMEKLEEYYAKVDEEWFGEIEELFVMKLQMPAETVIQYRNMREDFEIKKAEMLEDLLEKVEKTDEKVFMSEIDESINKKLLESYDLRLRQLLGSENYKEYEMLKIDFNERIRRESSEEEAIILIDF